MESPSPKLSVEALEIAQRLDSNPNLRAEVEEFIDLLDSGSWVAHAVTSLCASSKRHGHCEFAMEPTDVFREVSAGLTQWRIDMHFALELQKRYPLAFMDPDTWKRNNPDPETKAA